MPQNYVPIFIFIALVGTLLPLTLLLAKLVRPDNPSKAKLMAYECGIDPIDNARGRYTVRYYISLSSSWSSTWRRYFFFPGR
jgi:NADH-quinone oxidoreductase subunit A